jgi:hypothetical protein
MIQIFAMLVALAGPGVDADRPEVASDAGDRVICKRFAKTGSLVASYKDCKTKREWQREREARQQLSVVDSCAARGNGGAC